MSHLSVFEWGRVAILEQPGGAGFTRSQANALMAAARTHPLGGDEGTAILRDHYRHLTAGQMVGVLAAPGCSLEILPKIDAGASEPAEERRTVRSRLVRMLDVALGLNISDGASSVMASQAESLLDILIRLFADKLLAETRRGLPRAYLAHEEDLPTLRGRLNVVRQFTAHAVRPDRLACRFDALTSDIALMQVMKACVIALRRHARASETVRKLDELRFVLGDVSDVSAAALPWQSVRIDRTNRRWEALFGLARLFLKHDWQATHRDPKAAQGITLMFPMNDLFEAYIAALLRRSLRSAGLTVETQGGRLFCLVEEGKYGAKRFRTRPDIIVRDGRPNAPIAILDTKWKRLSPAVEDKKHGVSQADVYQMMAYGQLYDCAELLMLYPHHAGLGDAPFSAGYTVHGSTDRLHLRSIDLVREEAAIVADLAALFRDWHPIPLQAVG
ncbi:5-methylcytosine-specific restriction enzyme subunit McrC [Sphingobium sp. B2D3A]|uniref:McrC family protein n=1 Tax=unclassified Sphingobium TaxID=2611147 RepID=UPI0022253986|nr:MULTISPECIES: McrC family protein [unclassified Sphingobium]MCW2338227.1 5-methylcytosine-specific restriction enzyme subunit McrC [Sphingobium sp. B2D3A]MCW2384685.1 5-methylcytosine-specific restriction enzyme subunit McrC [Sphingobium sp. B2D3D]